MSALIDVRLEADNLEGTQSVIVEGYVDQGFREREPGESLFGQNKRSRKNRVLVSVDPAGRAVVP